MKKLYPFLFCVLASYSALHAQLPSAYTDRLNTVFDSICTKQNLKGASAAVLVPNMGTWSGVFGISHPGSPVTNDMLFGIGSNTKTMVSALLLKMQEMQHLSLNDTIGEWIINKPNINGQITIRQLLNHSSGLHSYTDNSWFYDSINANPARIWKLEEILAMVDVPYFAPGTDWEYSNTNYLIAGIIIEKVSNKPVEVALRDILFTPAGLTNTFYYPQETPSKPIAHCWTMGITGISLYDINSIPVYSNNALFSLASTAGAVMQTAEDNVLFWNKLMSGQIINNNSLNEMKQLVSIGGNVGYGLGVFRYRNYLNARTIYTHGGTNMGYINENITDTISGISISVLTNQDSIGNNDLLVKLIGAMHKVGLQMNITDVESKPALNPIKLFPNPATSKIFVDMNNLADVGSIEVYDMTGKKQLITILGDDKSFSINELPTGFYSVLIIDTNGNIAAQHKIVKR